MPYPPIENLRSLPPAERERLAHAANKAIGASFERTRGLFGAIYAGEVDLILGVFLDGLEQLETEWNALLSKRRVRIVVSGIFAHATPRVTPNYDSPSEEASAASALPNPSTRSCELGDILFVTLPVDSEKGIGNSVMFQVKKGFPSGGDPLQRRLYEFASHFNYRTPSSLAGQERCILGKKDSHLAYWDLGKKSTDTGYCILPNDARAGSLHPRTEIGKVLTDLLLGDFGKGFNRNCESGTSWSKIMNDLFTVTARSVVNRGSMNVRNHPRGEELDQIVWRLVSDSTAPHIVRNSLAAVFKHLDDTNLKNLGEKIEMNSRPPEFQNRKPSITDLMMGAEDGSHEGADRFYNPPIPPKSIDNDNRNQPESDGMSIVFIHAYPK